MSSLGQLVSDIGYAAGDRGSTSVTRNTKNPALQKRIDLGLTDYDTVRGEGQNALKDYITKYLAGEGAAKTRTGQEIGNLDRYFNGGVANELAALRASRAAAVNNAANLAGQYSLSSLNRSRVGGGPDSYYNRLLMRNLGDIHTQAALDAANQERGDWGTLENTRMGLTGQRQALANALAGYRLVPEQMRRQMYGQDLGYLGQLGQLDQSNNFYGLQYEPSFSEQAGAITGDVASLAASVYTMGAGDMMGGMGGGGGSGSNLASRSQPQWAMGGMPVGGYGGYPGGMYPGTSTGTYWGNPGVGGAPAGTTTNWGSFGGPTSQAPNYNPYSYSNPWQDPMGGWGSYGGL